ncbi:hypothetical protein [Stenotrophobium rhamnosiphilum]|uniref:Uncharacterized protein n=1 Tax=Stenotrophobium rhamnosiphilum TaxID=2029166 RepID=A0A2T5MIZ5_9GAMM|nr:hypothetical protein [Stenotrophobium rhamnosiphilum]PTU32551.1 hypothetical protein CJD38_00005 [Stenotrophobium rhamnosiphilum]
MKNSDSLLKWMAIALPILAGFFVILGTTLSISATRVGIVLFGLSMTANGALVIKTRRVSFARRARKEHYEGSDAFIVGAASTAFGMVIACWALFSWVH